VVESVQEIAQPGEGSGVGAVAGGVVGGLLGNQIGKGRGNTVATVAGAVGGAVAGHQIEKHVKKTVRYDITVRMEDASTRVVSTDSAPAWRTGDRVRVIDGRLVSDN
jgi:outer membrane lipoprotein SlyB